MNNYSFEDRLVIDYNDVKEVLGKILDEVCELRSDSFIKQILSESDSDQIKKWEKIIEKRSKDDFSLVIMGDFKRGKSTLINAIMGKHIVETNVSPETITINKVSYGEQPKSEAVLKNGIRIKLNPEELSRSELEKIIANCPAPVDYIDIRENSDILKELSIIDTPGLGDIFNLYNEQIIQYLINADAIVYVISVLSPLSETEQAFLCSSILPQSFSRLFVVANMADSFDSVEDIKKIKNEINNRVLAFTKNANVHVISALDEYCLKTGIRRPNPNLADYLSGAYEEFDHSLNNEIILQKDIIKTERLVTIVKAMTKDIRSRIHLISNMLQLDNKKMEEMESKLYNENANLNSSVKEAKEQMLDLVKSLSEEAKLWIGDFLDKVKHEIESIKNTADIVMLQKHFQFYMIDMVRIALNNCLKEHQPVIENKVKELTNEFARVHIAEDKKDQLSIIAVNVADISWTSIDTASLIIDYGISSTMPGIISYLGYAVAGFFRQSKLKKLQADYLAPVLENFEDIVTEVNKQIDNAYDAFGKSACDKIEETFRTQIENSIKTINQARTVAQNQEIKAEEVTTNIKSADKILDRIDELAAQLLPIRPEN